MPSEEAEIKIPDAKINTRNCASCMHWGPRDGERPFIHYGNELQKCTFFSQAPKERLPRQISHLATVAVGWSGDKYGDLMTNFAFGCIEWTLASPT